MLDVGGVAAGALAAVVVVATVLVPGFALLAAGVRGLKLPVPAAVSLALPADGAGASLLSAGGATGAPAPSGTLGLFSASAESVAGAADVDAGASTCIALKAKTAAPATPTRIKKTGAPSRANTSTELVDRERACGRELEGAEAETAKLAGAPGLAVLGGNGADVGEGTETGGNVAPN